jgi:hypothetical protein
MEGGGVVEVRPGRRLYVAAYVVENAEATVFFLHGRSDVQLLRQQWWRVFSVVAQRRQFAHRSRRTIGTVAKSGEIFSRAKNGLQLPLS